VQLSDVEVRVLGSLLEKQRTTPDAYPLSLNALRLACNQATNRDPVVEYDEAQIREALTRLGRLRYTRLTSTQGSRAAKFRHLLDETLGLSVPQQAVLAVLMLRGPQTPGELRQRTERLHGFPDFEALGAALAALIDRGLVQRLDRRPGQKEERYAQRLGGTAAAEGATSIVGGQTAGAHANAPAAEVAEGPAAPQPPPPADSATPPADRSASAPSQEPDAVVALARVERLERQVAELSRRVTELRVELGLEQPESSAP
jgi:uncharacterized protein YceH (UPF0502 family)